MQDQSSVPYGYCKCGCGEKTQVPASTDRHKGRVKGIPMPYKKGCSRRGVYLKDKRWEPRDAGHGTQCWAWLLAFDGRGYGVVRHEGKAKKAYKVEWEKVHGPVPAGLELDHLCRNRACVNPDHLEAVTRSVNQSRAVRKTTPEERKSVVPKMTREAAMSRFAISEGHYYRLKRLAR